ERRPGLGGDVDGARNQRNVGMKFRTACKNLQVKLASGADGDYFLPLGFGERAGAFAGKNVGGNEIMNSVQVFVTKRDGLHGIRARQHPGQSNRGVENVLHSSSRTSRRSSTTSISTFSWRRRSVIRS